MIRHYVGPAVMGGVGTLVLDIVYGYASPYLPATMQQGWFGVLSKLGVILGTGWAVSKFAPGLREKAKVAVLGATTVLAYGAIKQAAAGVLPAGIPGLAGLSAYQTDFTRMPVGLRGLNAYQRPMLGGLRDYYSPAAVIGASTAQPFSGLNAYQPHTGGVGGFDYMNDGM